MLRGLLVCLTLVYWISGPVEAADPLHRRIDSLIAVHKGPVAPRSSDAEFLRRVSLDFTGLIPTSKEARTFLADPSPGKRTKLIDRLLSSADYPQRMQYAFSTMLLERRESRLSPGRVRDWGLLDSTTWHGAVLEDDRWRSDSQLESRLSRS
jgi:hypothetical protein